MQITERLKRGGGTIFGRLFRPGGGGLDAGLLLGVLRGGGVGLSRGESTRWCYAFSRFCKLTQSERKGESVAVTIFSLYIHRSSAGLGPFWSVDRPQVGELGEGSSLFCARLPFWSGSGSRAASKFAVQNVRFFHKSHQLLTHICEDFVWVSPVFSKIYQFFC